MKLNPKYLQIPFLTFTIFLLLISCKDENDSTNYGEMTVKIDGMEWNGNVWTINAARINIQATKNKIIDGVSIPWETLELSLVYKIENKATLYKIDSMVYLHPELAKTYASFNTMQDDGDVLCDHYEVIESDSINNWVQITKQENNYSELWGNFSITFRRTIGCSSSIYADTLRFREGKFHVFLK